MPFGNLLVGRNPGATALTGEWRELGGRKEGRQVGPLEDWHDWWLMVVRDRSEDKLNGEVHSLRIDGSGSPQVSDFYRKAPVCRRSSRAPHHSVRGLLSRVTPLTKCLV